MPATISYQPLTFDDTGGKFNTSIQVAGLFTDYEINNRFVSDLSRFMAGITSPDGFQGASAAFFQLARPRLLWVCDWTACRLNTPPEIPDPESQDPNWILLGRTPAETAKIIVLPDGKTPVYRISGTYVYGHTNPNAKPHKDIFWGRPPWLQDSFERSLADGKLMQGLSIPQQSAAQGFSETGNSNPDQGFIDTGS